MGTVGPLPGAKPRPGRDTDHSPPSSAEVENEQELYFLSKQAPPWPVVERLYFFHYVLCCLFLQFLAHFNYNISAYHYLT
jgi:hypothetical protein